MSKNQTLPFINGITVQEPYLTQILNKEKQWEFRKYPIPEGYKNTLVLLLSKGIVHGYVIFNYDLLLSKPITFHLKQGDYIATHAWHILKSSKLNNMLNVKYTTIKYNQRSLLRNVQTDKPLKEEYFE